VKENHIHGPVFNAYHFGGYLIFSGVEPFVDGRTELYGDAATLTNPQLPELLNQYGITWTMFAPQTAAITLMDYLAGWRRLYADPVVVVHVRQTNPVRPSTEACRISCLEHERSGLVRA